MQILIIIALLIAVVAVIFALQNFTTITVVFLFWSWPGPVALVVLLSVIAGVLISVFTALPGQVRGKLTLNGQKKKLTAMQTERDSYKTRAEDAEKEVKALEEQLASLSAALEEHQSITPGEKPAA